MKNSGQSFLERLDELVGSNQSQFAKRLGISQSLLNKYVRGEVLPGFHFFDLLFRVMNADLNWLIAGSKPEGQRTHDEVEVLMQDLSETIRGLKRPQRALVLQMLESIQQSLRKRSF